jgi:hypothetical protein
VTSDNEAIQDLFDRDLKYEDVADGVCGGGREEGQSAFEMSIFVCMHYFL